MVCKHAIGFKHVWCSPLRGRHRAVHTERLTTMLAGNKHTERGLRCQSWVHAMVSAT